jgi:hypothetical protein
LRAEQVAARDAHIPQHDAGGEAALEPGQVAVLLDLDLAREMGALGDDERDPRQVYGTQWS